MFLGTNKNKDLGIKYRYAVLGSVSKYNSYKKTKYYQKDKGNFHLQDPREKNIKGRE